MTNEEIAAEMCKWRQGDAFLGAIDLPFLDIGEDGLDAVLTSSEGAVILTQSCDIVRDYSKRPFLHVAALKPVTDDELQRISAGREIRYLYVPGLRDRRLVADLDLTATIDKRIIVGQDRVPGCDTDRERRELAANIGRHRQRYAFPDEFNDALKPLRRWVDGGAGKNSDKGRFIDAILEIRVSTASWEAPDELEFIAILKDGIPPDTRALWARDYLPGLEKKASSDWCRDCTFRLSTLKEMSAAEYLGMDRLDFDGLSDA
ncbi:hypothetical protein [Jiella sonneratiae]|uniref:Uncharacterized protein n=1 Tax=Jiella sonneratiae TaxID=2816856 RepID=A0ABS3J2E7_9HYPH|nr:hypothetical protein [Jiella sonneratiae]MBO0903813.1 hypothetical protein [Jiella sonneratiae]